MTLLDYFLVLYFTSDFIKQLQRFVMKADQNCLYLVKLETCCTVICRPKASILCANSQTFP